jgi:hypothetical protein
VRAECGLVVTSSADVNQPLSLSGAR